MLDCIYLHPADNDQGGHEVMHLATSCHLTHHIVTHVPITSTVVSAVEALADSKDMKGLQFKTKTGQILSDSAWIAGVDYDDYDNYQGYYDEDVELPGVNINEEEEEQIWEDLDENKVTDLLGEVNPIQLAPHQEDHDAQQKDGVGQQEMANVKVETIDNEEEEDKDKTNAQQGQLRRSTRQTMPHMPMNIGHETSRGQSYMPHSYCGISEENMIEYHEDTAIVLAKIICELNGQQVN